jgi:hypothetical protein
MPSLTHREQAGLDSSHLSLLDLHTAQPVRDLVMFMRAAECVDESIMTPFGGIRVWTRNA